MAALDDACVDALLAFVNDPNARSCCRDWSSRLYELLQLKSVIEVHRSLQQKGKLSYFHTMMFDYGGMEDNYSYCFTFFPEHVYTLQWFREGLTSDNEQHYGRWRASLGHVRCETQAPPPSDSSSVQLRYAPPGRSFEVPVENVLAGRTQATEEPLLWEYPARGLKPLAIHVAIPPMEVVFEPTSPTAVTASPVLRADARFVTIDGEVHQVCEDIMANWPENDWERLMRCRIRFGTGTERWP